MNLARIVHAIASSSGKKHREGATGFHRHSKYQDATPRLRQRTWDGA